jgi:hypothetical protein
MKSACFPLELAKPLFRKAYTRDAYAPLRCRGVNSACAGHTLVRRQTPSPKTTPERCQNASIGLGSTNLLVAFGHGYPVAACPNLPLTRKPAPRSLVLGAFRTWHDTKITSEFPLSSLSVSSLESSISTSITYSESYLIA